MKVNRKQQAQAISMLPKLIAGANEVLEAILENFSDQLGGRAGFFITLADWKGEPLVTVPIGQPDNAKIPKYAQFSVEKPWRTGRNKHQASSQSRNLEADEYGGGFLFPGTHWGLGISGLPEDWDFAAVLAVGVLMGFTKQEQALVLSGQFKVEHDRYIEYLQAA